MNTENMCEHMKILSERIDKLEKLDNSLARKVALDRAKTKMELETIERYQGKQQAAIEELDACQKAHHDDERELDEKYGLLIENLSNTVDCLRATESCHNQELMRTMAKMLGEIDGLRLRLQKAEEALALESRKQSKCAKERYADSPSLEVEGCTESGEFVKCEACGRNKGRKYETSDAASLGWEQWKNDIKELFPNIKEVHIPSNQSEKNISERTKETIHMNIEDIDLSDHQTLNYFFKTFVSHLNNDETNFMRWIWAFERAAKEVDKLDYCTLLELINYLGLRDGLSVRDEEELERYRWVKDTHPFKYQLNACDPNEDGYIEYYVVFSCPPTYED